MKHSTKIELLCDVVWSLAWLLVIAVLVLRYQWGSSSLFPLVFLVAWPSYIIMKIIQGKANKSKICLHLKDTQKISEQVDFVDNAYNISGCCGGGCWVVQGIKYCPFCGIELDQPPVKEGD